MFFISQLKLKGFKSFKNADLSFSPTFVCLAGPNGSGKCVEGDTNVSLADGSLVKIRDIFHEASEKGISEEIEDGVIIRGHRKEILCLDTKTLKVVPKEVYAFVKRTSPKNLFKIITKSGREITTTGYHPLFVYDGLNIKPVNADELKKGTKIAIPREISIEPKDNLFLDLLDKIEIEDRLYVPYSSILSNIIRDKKGRETYNEFSKRAGIPNSILKSFFDKQSINFYYLIRMLRYCGFDDKKIISMVPDVRSKRNKKMLPIPWKNSNEFCRFLGYLLSEGQVTKSNQIRFTNGTKELVEDYVSLVEKLFGEKATVNRYKPGSWDVLFYSSVLSRILLKFGMSYKGSGAKFIPSFLLKSSSNENLGNILSGIYSGDGYISNKSIEVTTKSEKLARGIENALFRLGIVPRTRLREKRESTTGFTGKYYYVYIFSTPDCRTFNRWVDLKHAKKQERVLNLLDRKPNSNVDLIDVNSLVKQTVKDLSINVKHNRQSYPLLDAYCYNQCTPSRLGVTNLVDNLFKPMLSESQIISESFQKLKCMSESNIFWDEIVSIEKVDNKEQWVYDLSVEDHHNFIANNIFVHNSNIVDGIRFSLGETSLKSIRAKNVKNLIFSDSHAAEVTILLEEKDGQGRKYEIRRAIRSDGKILYRLNKKRATRTSIIELLKTCNIDESGRNIIAQGKVQGIVEMSGKERRQIIESVAGISDFEKKKEDALRELDHVQTRIREASIVMGERSAYLNELGREKEIAIRYNASKSNLRNAKGTVLKVEIEKLDGQLERTFEHTAKITLTIKQKSELIEESNHKISELESKRSGVSDKLRAKQQNAELIRNIEKLKASAESKNQLLEDREIQLEEVDKAKKLLGKELAEDSKEIDTLLKEVSELEQDFAKIAPTIQETDVGTNIREMNSALEKKHAQFLELKDELASVDSSIKTKQEVIKLKKEQLSELEDSLKSFKGIDFSNREAALKSRLSELSQEIDDLFDQEKKSNTDIAELDRKVLSVREKIAQFKAQSAPSAANSGLFYIDEMRKSNMVRGIYGTLADLITFDSKYAAAVEAALGPRLFYLVVKDVDTASHIISNLKKLGKGRATFIPLDKIESRRVDRKENLILNYLSYEPAVIKAIEFACSDTLLVNDIEEAKKLGIGKRRMVTLDGELFETSGLISGGKLRSSALASVQVRKHEEELESIKEERKKIMDGLENLREEGNLKRKESAEVSIDLKSLEIERRNFDDSIKKMEDVKSQIKELTSKISSLESEISKHSREKSELEESLSAVVKETESLKSQITSEEEKSAERYELITKKKTDAASRFSSLKATIEGKKNELELRKSEYKKKVEEEKILSSKVNELVLAMKNLKKERESLSKQLVEEEQKVKQFSKEMEELFTQMKKLEDNLRVLGEERGKINLEIDRLEKDLNQEKIIEATLKTRIVDFKSEFEGYTNIEFLSLSEEELKKMIKEAEAVLNSIQSVNLAAIELYEKKKQELDEIDRSISKLSDERKAILNMIDEIELRKKEAFFETYDAVNDNFVKMVKYIGMDDGFLYLDKQNTPFESGLYMKIKRHGREISVDSLSGGESSLVALAFIFAIQFFKPSPFYILDEVDAALDKQNSKSLIRLVKEISKSSQFILVSHNDNVIEGADAIIGVTKVDGISKVVGVNLQSIAAG